MVHGSDAPAPVHKIPAGVRIYAFGDVHGRFDRLTALYEGVREDLERRPAERSIEIFLGDYIDRGPQSRDVLEWLIAEAPASDQRICLQGNHEDMLLAAIADPGAASNWLYNGGLATFISYGAIRPEDLPRLTVGQALDEFVAAFPPEHLAFVEALPHAARFGDYMFVHAGVRPGRPLDRQDPNDLVWIREPFLSSRADFGARIVHGHTPVEAPEIRPNRINIDTGAVFTGRLTCLILDGDGLRLLQTPPD